MATIFAFTASRSKLTVLINVKKEMTTNFRGLNLRQLGDQEFNVVKVASKFTKYAIQVNEPNK